VPVTVHVTLNGVSVPVTLDDEALAAIAAALPREPVAEAAPFLTIPEAAERLGYGLWPDGHEKAGQRKRHRVDYLLSAGKLKRHKDGKRTLVARAELDTYLDGGGR
jgi:hypothetical protein